MTTPAAKVAASRKGHLNRDTIIKALRDYAELYGDDFASWAFSPSVAKWNDRPEARERYLAGNPKTGEPWPSLNAIKTHFGGFNAARVAAGLPANKPGPAKGRRPAGEAAPIRGVDDRVRVIYRDREVPTSETRESDPETRKLVRDLERALTRADERMAKLERQADKAAERLHAVRARRDELTVKAQKQRERADRQTARADQLAAEVADLRAAVKAAEGERSEWSAEAVEAALAESGLRVELDAARVELEELRARAELADGGVLEQAASEVAEARERVQHARQAQREAEHAARDAESARRGAVSLARKAEADAADERARRVAIQEAVAGHQRRLTPAELAELRSTGPAGLPVLTAAMKRVLKAQGVGPRKAALREVATAAIRWAERL